MSIKKHADELGEALRGRLIRPEDPGYDGARRVWNGMIDKRPALIAQCAGVSDVVKAVNFARERGMALAVRGGGHNVAGNATCDAGLVLDLSPMKSVRVDPARRTARAEGGVTWGEYDQETQVFGLASPGGAISTTGIAGLTLGGGFGWLSRSYGMACDALVAADVVTADGEVHQVSAESDPDLFWAIRGGGGNFGVVTSFEYRLQPVRELLSGLVIHPRSAARDLLLKFTEWTAQAPDEVSSMAALLHSPDGDPVAAVFVAYNGPVAEGERVLAPLRKFGSPLADDIAPKPYCAVQQTLDGGFPPGKRNYWKSSFLKGLDEDCIDALVEHGNRAPSPLSAVGVEHTFGGAVGRVGADETAFGERDAQYNLVILGIWEKADDDGSNIEWARGMWQAAQPYSTGSVYVNYLNWEEADRIGEAYDAKHYKRLVELKNRYDPQNLFRLNQNIAPTK